MPIKGLPTRKSAWGIALPGSRVPDKAKFIEPLPTIGVHRIKKRALERNPPSKVVIALSVAFWNVAMTLTFLELDQNSEGVFPIHVQWVPDKAELIETLLSAHLSRRRSTSRSFLTGVDIFEGEHYRFGG